MANQVAQQTSTVYRWIIDDVIAKMKPEVVQEGLDESVLDDLRALWEHKLMERGLLQAEASQAGPADGAGASTVPPAIQVPSVLPGSMQAMLAGMQGGMGQYNAAAAASFTAQLAAVTGANPNTTPAAALAAALAAGAIKNLKREAPDSGFDAVNRLAAAAGFSIPQRDGAADEGEDGDGDGDAAEAAGEAAGEEPASDEVLSEDEEEEEEEDEDQPNFLCCQFEKVGRTKNKWKVAMKEGVFHINGKDYLFKKAQGEWIF